MQNTSTVPTTQKSNLKEHNEWRCECGRLLFKGALLVGLLEVKCSRCKRMVYLQQFDSYTAEHQSFMATLSSDGTILTASHGLEKSLGYEESEVVGNNLIEYISPKLHSAVGFWMEDIKQGRGDGGSYTSVIVPLINKSGHEQIFSLLVRPTQLSGKEIYLVIAEAGLDSADMHDKKVISKLAKRDRSQREGWDFIISQDGQIIDSSGKSNLGYGQKDLLNKSFLDLLETPSEELKGKLNTQESFVLSLKLKTESSEYKDCQVCFVPDFLADPKEPAFIVSIRVNPGSQAE